MNEFWPTFWPNLASTVIGVALGLPGGLWLNRIAGKAAENARAAERSTRLTNGLRALLAALDHNSQRLRALVDMLAQRGAPFEADFDTAVWEASRDAIVPALENPDLQRRLAFHFGRLDGLSRLCPLYLDLTVGLQASVSGSESTRSALGNYLGARSNELLTEAGQLTQEVRTAMPIEPAAGRWSRVRLLASRFRA